MVASASAGITVDLRAARRVVAFVSFGVDTGRVARLRAVVGQRSGGRLRPLRRRVDSRSALTCGLCADRGTSLRVEVEGLVLTGGRMHFHNESVRRRREILGRFGAYPIAAFVVVCHRNHGITGFRARELCAGTTFASRFERPVGATRAEPGSPTKGLATGRTSYSAGRRRP